MPRADAAEEPSHTSAAGSFMRPLWGQGTPWLATNPQEKLHDALFVGAGAPRSGAAPPWAFDCAVPPVEDLPPTIEGVYLAR